MQEEVFWKGHSRSHYEGWSGFQAGLWCTVDVCQVGYLEWHAAYEGSVNSGKGMN